tara:strand:+ start:334 stop:477 length:144 start_codon:yes stop_codon:yes gene_type:complete
MMQAYPSISTGKKKGVYGIKLFFINMLFIEIFMIFIEIKKERGTPFF